MTSSTQKSVSVPKSVQIKTPTKPLPILVVHYTTHPRYLEVSCNNKLDNVGKDVTLMMLQESLDDNLNVVDESLFISKLNTMIKSGKRPPSTTKGDKDDYTPEMIELETKVNMIIKGLKLTNVKGDIIKPMFYMRNETKLKQNKGNKKKPLEFYSNKEEKKSSK